LVIRPPIALTDSRLLLEPAYIGDDLSHLVRVHFGDGRHILKAPVKGADPMFDCLIKGVVAAVAMLPVKRHPFFVLEELLGRLVEPMLAWLGTPVQGLYCTLRLKGTLTSD
jgi:hypothetical protein